MKRDYIIYPLVGAFLLLPTTADAGRFKDKFKSFYNRATKLDHSSTEEERERAKDAAGTILENVFQIPEARNMIEGIDELNKSDSSYQEQLERNREIIEERRR